MDDETRAQRYRDRQLDEYLDRYHMDPDVADCMERLANERTRELRKMHPMELVMELHDGEEMQVIEFARLAEVLHADAYESNSDSQGRTIYIAWQSSVIDAILDSEEDERYNQAVAEVGE